MTYVGTHKQFATADAAANDAARMLVESFQAAVNDRGQAVWVLAGGSSPMSAYRELVSRWADEVDWSRVTAIVGDERHVPFDSPDSNWGTISKVFAGTPMSRMKVLLPDVSGTTELAAATLRSQIEMLPTNDSGVPFIDLLWLGVGEDGHTLSVFPGRLEATDTEDLAIAVYDSPKMPPERITLTLRALEGVSDAIIFATGAAKRDALNAVARGEGLPIALAAERVINGGGSVHWLFDDSAREVAD